MIIPRKCHLCGSRDLVRDFKVGKNVRRWICKKCGKGQSYIEATEMREQSEK